MKHRRVFVENGCFDQWGVYTTFYYTIGWFYSVGPTKNGLWILAKEYWEYLTEPRKTRIAKTQRTKTNILMSQLVILGGLIFEVTLGRSHDLRWRSRTTQQSLIPQTNIGLIKTWLSQPDCISIQPARFVPSPIQLKHFHNLFC